MNLQNRLLPRFEAKSQYKLIGPTSSRLSLDARGDHSACHIFRRHLDSVPAVSVAVSRPRRIVRMAPEGVLWSEAQKLRVSCLVRLSVVRGLRIPQGAGLLILDRGKGSPRPDLPWRKETPLCIVNVVRR
jgi:hypothetical protein